MDNRTVPRSNPEGVIFNIQRFSIHDGPGIRTTVFFKGCPLRCAWCHNPESQDYGLSVMHWQDRCVGCRVCVAACPEQRIAFTPTGQVREGCSGCGACIFACPHGALELVGRIVSASEVTVELLKDEAFYDQSGGGVTFSGGEPLTQPDFLAALLQDAKRYRWHTAVDTSGYAPWSVLEPLLPLVDLWLYDLKLMDDQAHQRLIGVSNQLILDNLRCLVDAGSKVEVRMPLVPGINDDDENLSQLEAFLRPLAISGLKLLPYHSYGTEKYARLAMPYRLGEIEPPSEERMAALKRRLQASGLPVIM
ncbi:MAG: glycyl-radical enzyme activating protein [Bacillota bacterium]